MDLKEYFDLKPGDVVLNEGSGQSYVILEVRQEGVFFVAVAARTVIVTHPDEWRVIRKGLPARAT